MVGVSLRSTNKVTLCPLAKGLRSPPPVSYPPQSPLKIFSLPITLWADDELCPQSHR